MRYVRSRRPQANLTTYKSSDERVRTPRATPIQFSQFILLLRLTHDLAIEASTILTQGGLPLLAFSSIIKPPHVVISTRKV